jgi:glycosyltransferase involved in cell wall biosynthesis
MPLYNAARFLPDAIEGILHQTYREIELIIVDNCSTDGSYEIADRYAAADPRIRLSRNRYNVGYAGNLDKASSLARGNLMLIHCADDTAEPVAIERMVSVFDRPDVNPANTIVMADVFVMTREGRREYVVTRRSDGFINTSVPLDKYRQHSRLDRFTGVTALADAMSRLRTVGWVGAIMYARELCEAVEGVRSTRILNPDKHYLYKLLSRNPEVIWIHEPLFSWRQHEENQTALERAQGAIKQSLDDYIYTFEYPTATLTQWGVERGAMIQAFIDRGCLRKALAEIAHGSRLLALRYLFFALAAYPSTALANAKFYVAALGVLFGPFGTLAARAGHRLGIWRTEARPQS